MSKLIFSLTILLTLTVTTCCSANQPTRQSRGEPLTPTATQIVLATPTPKPAPATPTPKPSFTPLPTSKVESTATSFAIAEDMVLIPAGTFTMGQNGNKPKNTPAHAVDLPIYHIDRFEVTNDEFARFVKSSSYVTYADMNSTTKNNLQNWSEAAKGKGNHPIVYVTWNDAQAYCQWAGKRLPTEAEWEKAARGTDGRIFPWGNKFESGRGNFYESGIRGTTAVGSFHDGASPYGVEDMAGNVREWVADEFLPYPGQSSTADRFFGKPHRVHRGGGWFDGADEDVITTYNRNAGPADTSANDDIGFRCAKDN